MQTAILRYTIALVLLTHSIFGIFDGGVRSFGVDYLDPAGFAPFGLYLAWAIKGSHIVCALLFILNKYVKPAAILTIFILVVGIIMVHFKEGWFVVGGGRNGMEYNIVLIAVLLTIMYPNGFLVKWNR